MESHPPSVLPTIVGPEGDDSEPAADETALSVRRRRFRRSVLSNQKAMVGATIVVLIAIAATFAPFIAPYDPNSQDLTAALRPPFFAGGTPAHLFGTDGLGRDVLSRIIFGSRISLLIGVVSVLVSGVIGVTVGALAGYIGRFFDAVVMRLVDLQLSIPFLVLALAVLAAFGTSLRNLIAVLVVSGWVNYARIARGEVLSVREREYIAAARALGMSNTRILLRHVLPALTSPMIVVATLQVGLMILTEASLSFLGLGVPPDTPSWGSIAADGRDYLTTAWWITTMSGLTIFVTALGINFLGDWLRDTLDPHLGV